jgi:RNA polymerase sigma factor (sigma-70 family)
MKMTTNDLELLGQFVREKSQDAFTEIVNRHLNLVYSAALRQVRSVHQAEEVSQTVFTNLARNAGKLGPDTILSAWLYRVTRHAAIDLIRSEVRRRAREQISLEMSATNGSSAGWEQIEPLLDEAMESLEEADRASIVLRYFENKSLREVGQALGVSEDAAQKRVSRAVDHLRDYFSERKVAVGAGALGVVLAANAVQAAPPALYAVVAAAAAPTATAAALTTTTAVVAKTALIAMTTTQKVLFTAVLAVALAGGIYEAKQASALREQVQTLQSQQEQQSAQVKELDNLRHERDQLAKSKAQLMAENETLKKQPADVLKLRGQVGRLQQEKASIGSTSSLSKAAANPEVRKLIRDQQKMGMAMIYKKFADSAKLSPDDTAKLNDILADHVMNNVDQITGLLKNKASIDEMNQVFAAQDAALQDKLSTLLGPDGLAAYQDYTKNLASTLTAEQFKGQMTGSDDDKTGKVTQLSQLMEQEVASALSNANLPADYQLVPTLNFINFASEQAQNQNLALLSNIYQNVSAKAGSFLSPDEVTKFQTFTTTAIKNNSSALMLNRSMMAPISN